MQYKISKTLNLNRCIEFLRVSLFEKVVNSFLFGFSSQSLHEAQELIYLNICRVDGDKIAFLHCT